MGRGRAHIPKPSRMAGLARDAARRARRQLGREPTDDDLYSHLMYPQVFADF